MLIKSKKCEKCGKVYPTTAVSECPHSTREMDMMADKTLRPTEVDMLKAIADHRHILELNGHKPTRKDSLEAVLQLGIEKGRQQVIEWGNGDCPHYPPNPNSRIGSFRKGLRRKDCPDCWAELQKEDKK